VALLQTKNTLDEVVRHTQEAMDEACEKLEIDGKYDARSLNVTVAGPVR